MIGCKFGGKWGYYQSFHGCLNISMPLCHLYIMGTLLCLIVVVGYFSIFSHQFHFINPSSVKGGGFHPHVGKIDILSEIYDFCSRPSRYVTKIFNYIISRSVNRLFNPEVIKTALFTIFLLFLQAKNFRINF